MVNNMIPNVHLRKHWTGFVRTWFNQAARKRRRQLRRQQRSLALSPRPVQRLRPITRGQTIRYNNVEKLGRGFSLQELKEAGLNSKFAKTIGIAVDHRRYNRSQEGFTENVRRLKAYTSKLVLYPRHAGKPVKGVVADSSNEVVAVAVSQNTNPAVINLPTRNDRQKGVIVSAELKKGSAFRTIRQAWYNAKFVGVKQKKREALEAKKQ